MIYYNLPLDTAAKQNLGKVFSDLINKYFRAEHPFSKIFNSKSIKLFYCCLPIMQQIIQSHNRKLLRNDSAVDDFKCLKKSKHKYPLPGKFNTENIIYKTTVTSDICVKTYIGTTGQSFNKSWYGYVPSFLSKFKFEIIRVLLNDCNFCSTSNMSHSLVVPLVEFYNRARLSVNQWRTVSQSQVYITQKRIPQLQFISTVK